MLQGERPMAKDNRSLGRFMLTGIPPAPRACLRLRSPSTSMPTASESVGQDMGTGKEQNITIKASAQPRRGQRSWSKRPEARRGRQEAARDHESQEQPGAPCLHSGEEPQGCGDKVSADEKSKVEKALESAKETLKTGSTEELKKAADDLRDAAAKLAEELYRHAAASGDGSQGSRGQDAGSAGQDGQPKGEVYDADFKEKDKEDPKH